ncbi:MAG: hypothetical protein O3C65_02950 [Proteobacteria bacterium]|nr:hypothetical protein [Pseudomonadota bacterium]MDA1057619.1 hypothetical protein [Pseudomonadota bacterium]
MIRPAVIAGLVLLAVMVTGLFELKYEVRDLAQQKALLRSEIADERETLRVWQAEWSFLNQPARIQDLAARYLDLGTPLASQVGDADRIPFRTSADEVAQAEPTARRAQ